MKRYYWLEEQLDREDLTDEEYDLYNPEINALQEIINANTAEKRQAEIDKLNRIQKLFEEERVNELVEEYGQQFIGDYTITETFQVISFAFNDRNPDQQKVWDHNCHADAVKKLHQLLYYRVYDHYIRNRTQF